MPAPRGAQCPAPGRRSTGVASPWCAAKRQSWLSNQIVARDVELGLDDRFGWVRFVAAAIDDADANLVYEQIGRTGFKIVDEPGQTLWWARDRYPRRYLHHIACGNGRQHLDA